MSCEQQLKIPATYVRGGTSKGVFFCLDNLPEAAQVAGQYRDELLLRVIGSPDPYNKQTDGMGGATSSTSKTVILSKSTITDHDVDYLFGQVAIDKPFVDWSGNCGNLSAAVGAVAIANGLVDASKLPKNGIAIVKIWQVNIQKTIIAHVPMYDSRVQELGDFELDGVTFPAAEIQLDFIDPSGQDSNVFPTGNLKDKLSVPELGEFEVTMINAGIPTLFIEAKALNYTGLELQDDINSDSKALAMFELIRAHGAVKMGLIKHIDEAKTRLHTPKIAFVGPAAEYISSSGKTVLKSNIDLVVRALSMGQLHHAMMGTAAVAIASAAVIPGTIVNECIDGVVKNDICFGHPSGTLKVGATAYQANGQWIIEKVTMSRSARTLMEGSIRVPAPKQGIRK